MTHIGTKPTNLAGTFIALPASPVDGQQLVWNQSLSAWVPGSASTAEIGVGGSNVTGTGTTVAANTGGGGGAVVDVPSATLSLSADPRPVWVRALCTFQQTVVGDGVLSLYLYETTGGTSTAVAQIGSVRLPNTVAAVIKTVMYVSLPYRLGVVSSARTFKLSGQVNGIAATSTVNILNSATFPTRLWGATG